MNDEASADKGAGLPAPAASAGPWSGLGFPDLPVISAARGLRGLEGDQYDEMGQPLHGRSDYDAFRQFGKIWHSDAAPADKLGQLWRWSNYTVPDAEQRRLETMREWGIVPATEADRRLDQIEGSPVGAVAMGTTALLGGSDRAQGLALDLGATADNAMQAASGWGSRTSYPVAAERPAGLDASAGWASTLAEPRREPPTQGDIASLVAEHSKNNPVPLTEAGARAIIEQTQPWWTSVGVSGDNVKGPDLLFPGSSNSEVQIKAVKKPERFEEAVRMELRRQRDANESGRVSFASPVIAVQVPAEADPEQLMGKLRSNFSNYDVEPHSVVVVDPEGKVLIPKQPFPRQRTRNE